MGRKVNENQTFNRKRPFKRPSMKSRFLRGLPMLKASCEGTSFRDFPYTDNLRGILCG